MSRIQTHHRFARITLAVGLTMITAAVSAAGEQEYESGMKAFKSDDLITAMQYLGQAAEKGNADAEYLLGFILDNADDNESARRHYLSAAEKGSADAAYALGTMYSSGDGVERNYDTAVDWYQRASDAGHGGASETLGLAYLEGGLGLNKDEDKARSLLQRASELGVPSANSTLHQLAPKQSEGEKQ
ncbi:MAG: sel1 repeat family protein [Gammaproteobacteria bacterium]|nr:sel1 repeat family protein [Gammaproteobacteria bacterium]